MRVCRKECFFLVFDLEELGNLHSGRWKKVLVLESDTSSNSRSSLRPQEGYLTFLSSVLGEIKP